MNGDSVVNRVSEYLPGHVFVLIIWLLFVALIAQANPAHAGSISAPVAAASTGTSAPRVTQDAFHLKVSGSDIGIGSLEDFCRINRGNPIACALVQESGHRGLASITLAPQSDLPILLEDATLNVKSGSVVHISDWEGGVALYDLHDTKSGSVTLTIDGTELELRPGTMIALGRSSKGVVRLPVSLGRVGIRRSKSQVLPSGRALLEADFSIISAMTCIEQLHAVRQSDLRQDRKLTSTLLKTACTQTLVLSKYGPFAPPRSF